MTSELDNIDDGRKLYEWACMGERELCKYLDSNRDQSLNLSFVHATLLMLKLFEPDNILIDGNAYFHNVLVILDDFHKLSEEQRRNVSEAIYTLKASTGVWLGQRLEGIENVQLISMDGSLGRDYNSNIVIDNYWPEKAGTFYAMLERIADRRVKEAGLGKYLKLSDCIADGLEKKKYIRVLQRFNESIRNKIENEMETAHIYQNILKYLGEDHDLDILEQSIWYECLVIKENRRTSGQLSLFLGESVTVEAFKEFVKENKVASKYYLCRKTQLPFYFGIDNLKILSSYNVEQFLYFAGAYLDYCRIKTLGESPRAKKRLTAEEQEKALLSAVEKKWLDMDFRYNNIRTIKVFLDNIAGECIKSRDEERASYCGGAYTGIGIKKDVLLNGIRRPYYLKLAEILGACIASKYLERKEINNGEIIVFYLNRWLCVHYGLPLAYGGWKRCGIDAVLNLCKNDSLDTDINQMTFSL